MTVNIKILKKEVILFLTVPMMDVYLYYYKKSELLLKKRHFLKHILTATLMEVELKMNQNFLYRQLKKQL